MATLEFVGKDASQFADFAPDPVLKKGKGYGLNRKGRLLVHGDNLQAMRALMPSIEGKVKLIYIDPPYNTGRQFTHYSDKLNRRYIGIELGTAFDKVLVPRMKKVVDGEQGGISEAVNWKGGHGFNICAII